MTPPAPFDVVLRVLDGRTPRTAAVVLRGPDHPLPGRIRSAFADARVVVLDARDGLDRLHLGLAVAAPYDLVVDLAGGAQADRRFRTELFHLRPGGTAVVRLPDDPSLTDLLADVQDLRASGELQPPTIGKDKRPGKVRDLHALAASVGDVEVRDGYAVVVNQVATLAKIPELSMNDLLAVRPDLGEVLDTIPAVTWGSRCRVRHSETDRPPALPTAYAAPELSLRHYRDVVCRPRQVAVAGHVVLPESYRHNAKKRLRNQMLVEWAPWFVRDDEEATTVLDGSYFYLDNHVRGHFGHVLTEQISHLWGWRGAKERDPSLKALVFEWQGGEPMADWEYDLLAAGGVDRDDVVVATTPVRVASLVATSPMFSMPDFVHPEIAATYDGIGAALAAQAGQREWPRRVFCTRRGRKRACHNADEVEALFTEAGFEVVLPEELSLADQVQLVRRAEVIGGFAGSGMFQVAFAGAPKHVIIVGSESYTASNEYLVSSVLGHRLDLVLCRPDQPRGTRFTATSYQSDFTFDPAHEGVFLREVLAALD